MSKFILYITPQLIVMFLLSPWLYVSTVKIPPSVHTDDKIFTIYFFLHFTIMQQANGALAGPLQGLSV